MPILKLCANLTPSYIYENMGASHI